MLPVLVFRGRCVNNMRLAKWFANPIKHLLGLQFEIRGAEHLLRPGPYIIVSNHQSSLDFLGMMEVLPERTVPVAKKEVLMFTGAFGLASYLCGTVFIDRRQPGAARGTLEKTACSLHQDNIRLWIFPEGTRNHGRHLLNFRRGGFHLAVQAQVPIIPVVFSSYAKFYNKKDRKFNSGLCCLTVLPPVETRGLNVTDVPELTTNVQCAMSSFFMDNQ
uniref:1-acyl-sn-glycerol-3-phosphate acyltransferase alpha-like n=1 Tax=Myxine glutinosa TaxID=7769 RepID=UPI00358F1105